jgi:predicted NUDIX family NTP pyrophosphohydrolase
MTAPRSAGVLIHRRRAGAVEVLLVHPGGPYWRKRDRGAWQIPKGMIEEVEEAASAARREAEEELGLALDGDLVPLGEIRQAGGKYVEAFAIAADFDPADIDSILFEMEWPPKSGRTQEFPEIDAARWFSLAEAGDMMLDSQKPLLTALALVIGEC